MNDADSPVLRLIPYLAAITVTIFATLAITGGGESNLLVTLVTAVISYFGTFYIVGFLIRLIVRRSHDDHSNEDDDGSDDRQ